MSFIYPGFLFALLAIAVPILIHLFNFRKFKKIYFSNVRFLRNIEVQTSSSRNLRRLLILLARIGCILFLVLAFAKPFIPNGKSTGTADRNAVSIYVDNSYSMEAVNKNGSLFDEARRRAKEIAQAYGLNARFQLLTNDFEGRHQRLLSYEDFLSALDELKISGITRTVPQILKRQEDILAAETNASKTSYLLSDFQENMAPKSEFAPDSAISIRFVKIESTTLPNISIDSVWFVSPIHKPGATEKLVVRLRNNSDKEGQRIPVKLLIGGQQKAVASITVPPNTVKSDTLSFSGLKAGWQNGRVQIIDYPVVFDDQYFFAFHVRPALKILVVNDGASSQYLNAVYRSDPFFSLSNTGSGNINYAALNSYPLIVLNSLPAFSPGLIQQLQKYVSDGGSLIIFPSLTGQQNDLSALLNSLRADVPEQVSETEQKVTSLNTRHPLLRDVFEKVPGNIDLPVARKYIRYSQRSATTRQSVLDLPGGGSFFSQYTYAKGSVYLSAVPLDEDAGNFARHSVFVPLMYQAALLSLRDSRMAYTLGKDQFFETGKVSLSNNQVLKLKKDKFEVIPDVQQTEHATRIYIADQLREEGTYALVKGDSTLALAGFNDNPEESKLEYLDAKKLGSMFPGKKISLINTAKATIQNEIKGINEGTHLWKLCLILALLFLAAEVLLLRFFRVNDIEKNTS